MDEIATLISDETRRRSDFPICAGKTFLAHAAVCPLPRVAADALKTHAEEATVSGPDDYVHALRQIRAARETCARLIDGTPEEIALLGPTSLGLSLFAGGLDWSPGDEVVYHADDYPANVYPWLDLARRGVVPRALRPERPGEITPEVVAAALTPRTRLVALASAFFLTGFRIDVDASVGCCTKAACCFRWMPSKRSARFHCPCSTSIFWRRMPISGCSDRSRRESCT